jgi:excisionase family DNA binding protein
MQIYTVRDVAELLKVSPRTVERLIAQKQLRALHIGRRLRVTHDSLQAYLSGAEGRDETNN